MTREVSVPNVSHMLQLGALVVAFSVSVVATALVTSGTVVTSTEVSRKIAAEAPFVADRARIDAELGALKESLKNRREDVLALQKQVAEIGEDVAVLKSRVEGLSLRPANHVEQAQCILVETPHPSGLSPEAMERLTREVLARGNN